MTLAEIQKKLARIRELSRLDDEAAHGAEDELFHEFIRFVEARGDVELSELAHAVLCSKEYDFGRWCA